MTKKTLVPLLIAAIGALVAVSAIVAALQPQEGATVDDPCFFPCSAEAAYAETTGAVAVALSEQGEDAAAAWDVWLDAVAMLVDCHEYEYR